MRHTLIILVVCGALGACNDIKTAADIKGACDAFDAPVQPIVGKTRIDQRWIDKAIESGISACGWTRPRAIENVNRAVKRNRAYTS